MEEGAGARKGKLVREAGHRHRHTHRGLNAYLLANLKDRFLKKQTKKDKIKKNKKQRKKPTRRYVDKQVGSGFSRFKDHPICGRAAQRD